MGELKSWKILVLGNSYVWRAGPIKWHWSNQDRIKYIKQSGVTYVN